MGVTGWVISTTVQLNDAKVAYDAALVELEADQSDIQAEATGVRNESVTTDR